MPKARLHMLHPTVNIGMPAVKVVCLRCLSAEGPSCIGV